VKLLSSQKVHQYKFERSTVDYIIRFLAGGLIVSAFAVLGDVLRPKSFAGLFGAAPSVALATLTLAFLKDGGATVAIEGRSMFLGALAFLLFSAVVCQLLVRFRRSAITATGSALLLWLIAACSLKQMILG
jgi:hypothetical protein